MESIIIKYLEGSASQQEQEKLFKWLKNNNNRPIFQKVKHNWQQKLKEDVFFGHGQEETWLKVQSNLWQKNYSGWNKSKKLQMVFSYAAIFILVISIGAFIFYSINRGKTMQLFYTSVIADKGQISKVNLPDGSQVWLNSGSEIKYNNFFASKNRDINLIGEAFFDVVRNENAPMVITCGVLQARVLGTRFNISAYPGNDYINIILEEGSVELKNTDVPSFEYKLKPGEMARFNKSNRELFVSQVNTVKYTSWREGTINIYDQPISEVAKRLNLRFNQKFEYSKEIENLKCTFTIKNESLEDIIKLIEQITPVYAVQEDGIIFLKPDKNKINEINKN